MYDGYCNTEQGIAYDYYDYDSMGYVDTADGCLAWCIDQKQTSPWRNFVACDYDEYYCNIIEDAVVTGGWMPDYIDVNIICWVFESGKPSKLTFCGLFDILF